MLSALVTTSKKSDAVTKPVKKTAAKPKTKKTKNVPLAHVDTALEYSDFHALPTEKNVPLAAPVHDLAFDAEEIEPEPTEDIDEWHEMMKAAEEDANEWDTDSKTDVAPSSELEDDFVDSRECAPPPPPEWRKTKNERKKEFKGMMLDFDDEFIP